MAILMPHQDCHINITVRGVQLTRTIEVTRSYPDNLCQFSFVGIQAWRRDFHRIGLGVNALSVIQEARKIDP